MTMLQIPISISTAVRLIVITGESSFAFEKLEFSFVTDDKATESSISFCLLSCSLRFAIKKFCMATIREDSSEIKTSAEQGSDNHQGKLGSEGISINAHIDPSQQN